MKKKNWYKEKQARATPIYETDLMLLKRMRRMDEALINTLSRLLNKYRKTEQELIDIGHKSGMSAEMIHKSVKNFMEEG